MYNKFIFKSFIFLGIITIIFWLFLYEYVIPIEVIKILNQEHGFRFEYLSITGLLPIVIGYASLKFFMKKESLLRNGVLLTGKILNFDSFSSTSKKMHLVAEFRGKEVFFSRLVHNFEYEHQYKGLIEIGNLVDVYINPDNIREYFVYLDTIRNN